MDQATVDRHEAALTALDALKADESADPKALADAYKELSVSSRARADEERADIVAEAEARGEEPPPEAPPLGHVTVTRASDDPAD